jgi:4-hydroxybenzoate polyprenyltransferase
MKRLIPFPQVVLGGIIGGAVFPGWIAITKQLDDLGDALPLFWATFCWVVYFDLFYATQDAPDDKKIGVKSLAVLLGGRIHVALAGLGLVQVICFVLTAAKADLSLIFWVLGISVWALNIPWHIISLDLNDRSSGGRIFKANIKLGLYMTGTSLVELAVTRVHFGSTVPYVKNLLSST